MAARKVNAMCHSFVRTNIKKELENRFIINSKLIEKYMKKIYNKTKTRYQIENVNLNVDVK